MSDQERDKLVKETDEEGAEDVEAHKHGGRDQHSGRGADEDASDDVEAHKLGGKDS